MNPDLNKLHPYPFERLRQLFSGVVPNPSCRPISLGIGEPKHATPAFIERALAHSLAGLASYPSTAGTDQLRRQISQGLSEAEIRQSWQSALAQFKRQRQPYLLYP